MGAYLIKRLLLLIPTFFGVTLITFLMLQLAPGNPAAMKLSGGPGGQLNSQTGASKEIIEQTRKLYGLDKPIPVQYWNWLKRLVTLDLGESFQDHRPVRDKLMETMPISLLFGIASTILVYMVIIPSGIYSAVRESGQDLAAFGIPLWMQGIVGGVLLIAVYLLAGLAGRLFIHHPTLDFFHLTAAIGVVLAVVAARFLPAFEVKTMTFFYFMLYCIPTFWLGIMGIVFLGGGDFWNVFPVYGLLSEGMENKSWLDFAKLKDLLWHMAMPLTCYTIGSFAFPTRQMASSLRDSLAMDFVNTAKTKGLPARTVTMKHALRYSLIPMVTLFAGFLPGLFASSVLIEKIFSIRGLGLLLFESLLARDYPVIMAGTVFTALLTLAGMLISDLMYVLVDPRIDFESAENA